MMKTTTWKEFTEGGRPYRIRATYGIDYPFGNRNNQQPHFSVTGEIERKLGNGRWGEDSCGMLHDDIAKHFPELEPYLKWHLVSLGEPMHYLANAKYWWEMAMGQRPRDAHEQVHPISAFQSTIVLGGIPGETMPYTNDWQDVERWLKDRLPKLMGRYAADMKALGVLE